MKNVSILFLLFFIATGQAQVIELEEAKVTYSSTAMEKLTNSTQVTMVIKEEFTGQFFSDPISFAKKHFNVKLINTQGQSDQIETYRVHFKTKNGGLQAYFNNKGNLIYTFQKFKNLPLPNALAHDLYRDYKGWTVTKNVYIASGKADQIDKEIHKIKLVKGKEVQRIKIKPVYVAVEKLAGN